MPTERLIAQVEAEIAANAPPSLLSLIEASQLQGDTPELESTAPLAIFSSASLQRAAPEGATKKLTRRSIR